MTTKQYGVIGFIGNKAIAQLRVSNKNYSSYVETLSKNGIRLNIDYSIVRVTKNFTTIQIICEMPILNKIKIQTRLNQIKVLQDQIHELADKL